MVVAGVGRSGPTIDDTTQGLVINGQIDEIVWELCSVDQGSIGGGIREPASRCYNGLVARGSVYTVITTNLIARAVEG